MPCNGGGPSYDGDDAFTLRIKKLECIICDLCTLLEDEGLVSSIPREAATIWKEHENEELQILTKKALAKLTVRERRILGIKPY